MFIGHMPGAYILAKKILKQQSNRVLILLACIAGVLPDIDILYFYLIDNRQHTHHSYWTHMPLFWMVVYAGLYLLAKVVGRGDYARPIMIMASCTFLHLVLDSIVGKIAWFYPLSDTYYHLFHVPSVYSWWVANYLLHWTFLFEIGLCIAAAYHWKYAKG